MSELQEPSKEGRLGAGFLLAGLVGTVIVTSYLVVAMQRSLWIDEGYSVYLSAKGLRGILDGLKVDSGPPLYYVLLTLWRQAFGDSEISVRAPSLVCYVLSLIVVYRCGRALFSDRSRASYAVLFYGLGFLAIQAAAEARMYALLALAVAASTLFFVRAFLAEKRGWRDAAAYAVAVVVGSFTHYWFFLTLVAQGLCGLVALPRRGVARLAAIQAFAVTPFLVLWSSTMLAQAGNGSIAWIPKPNATLLKDTLIALTGNGVSPFATYLGLVALLLVARRYPEIERSRSAVLENRKLAVVLAVLVMIPLLLPLALSFVKPVFLARCTVVAACPLALLLAMGLGRLTTPAVRLAVSVLLVAEAALGLWVRAATAPDMTDKYTAQCLTRCGLRGDVLVFTTISRLAVQYHLARMGAWGRFEVVTFPAEIDGHPGWRDVRAMLGRRAAIEAEADAVVDRIDSYLARNPYAMIWVLYGYDTEVTGVLKGALDRRFAPVDQIELLGESSAAHRQILAYASLPLSKTGVGPGRRPSGRMSWGASGTSGPGNP